MEGTAAGSCASPHGTDKTGMVGQSNFFLFWKMNFQSKPGTLRIDSGLLSVGSEIGVLLLFSLAIFAASVI